MEENTNISTLFFNAANKYPDVVAIIDGDTHITYKKLANDVKGHAAYLKEKGIQPGDRILIFVPMSIALYKTVLATFHIGAVAVFLDEWVSKERMEICCKIANCKGFSAPFKIRMMSLISKELRKIPVKLNPSGSVDNVDVNIYPALPGDTALITFTTGSTGTPKAADRTHDFLKEQYTALVPLLPAESKIDMTLLPIVLLLNLGYGKTSVIAKFNPRKPKNFDASVIYRQLRDLGVESLTFSPYFLVETAKYLLKNNMQLPNLKHIISGGGPVFQEDAEIIDKAFPNARCTIVYGSTEAEPIAHIELRQFLAVSKNMEMQQGLYVGKIDDAAKVKIIPVTEGEVSSIDPLPEDQTGEIVVSGKHVLTAYYNSEDAFRLNKIRENNIIWHRTGDAGRLDQNNELYLMGRCKQILVWNGHNYYPFLIEQYLKKIPGVISGTAILADDKPVLIIQPEEDKVKQNILHHLQKSKYNLFRIIFIQKMPMDKRHHTKIEYDALKLLFQSKK